MFSKHTTSVFGKIGVLLCLPAVLLLASDAQAQELCECVDVYRTTAVRKAPVRRVRASYRAKKVRKARANTAFRPAYVAVPVREVAYVDHDDDCEEVVAYRPTGRVYVAERVYTSGYSPKRVYTSSRLSGIPIDADYYDTARIARDYGYRDGWIDGRDAGMERDAYHPENSGDYEKATNGYEGDFGSKDLYRQAYRQAYLKGYNTGFRSVASSYAMRNIRNF